MRKRVSDLLGDHADRVIDVYRKANPGRDAVGHLFPDRQRPPLQRRR